MKRKMGLHKKISSIFDGVPIPKQGATPGASADGVLKQDPVVRPPSSVPENHVKPAFHEPPAAKKSVPIPETKEYSEDFSEIFHQGPLADAISKTKGLLYGSSTGVLTKRNLYMSAAVVILGLIFVVILFWLYGGSKKVRFADKNKDVGQAAAVDFNSIWDWPDPYPGRFRDPTRAGETVSAQSGDILVSGIVYSDKPVAIVSGQMLKVGDQISGCRVVNITRDYVEFESENGEKFTRTVGKGKE